MIKTVIVNVELKINVADDSDISTEEIVQELDYKFSTPSFMMDGGWDGYIAIVESDKITGFEEK